MTFPNNNVEKLFDILLDVTFSAFKGTVRYFHFFWIWNTLEIDEIKFLLLLQNLFGSSNIWDFVVLLMKFDDVRDLREFKRNLRICISRKFLFLFHNNQSMIFLSPAQLWKWYFIVSTAAFLTCNFDLDFDIKRIFTFKEDRTGGFCFLEFLTIGKSNFPACNFQFLGLILTTPAVASQELEKLWWNFGGWYKHSLQRFLSKNFLWKLFPNPFIFLFFRKAPVT